MNVRTAFFACTVVTFGAIAALMVTPLIQYVLAAGLLAFVLHPLHQRLEPRVGPRLSATALTALAVLGAVVPVLLISIVVLQTVSSFLTDVDEMAAIDTGREILIEDVGVDAIHLETTEDLFLAEAENVLAASLEMVLLEFVGLLYTTIEMSVGVMVLIFLLYYLLIDGEAFVTWIGETVPLEEDIRRRLFSEIDTVTWAVIRSHVLVALVEGILGGIGLYIFGIPNVVFWTVVMIVVSFLPIVGVWLVWGPAVGYLIVTGDTLPGIAFLLYGATILSLSDNYLRAIFVDQRSGVHPAVALIGVIGGIYLLGIMGLFLGPILLAVFTACLNVFGETYPIGTDREPDVDEDVPTELADPDDPIPVQEPDPAER